MLFRSNGITIVADELDTTRNDFTITNYQIINGCQTANVLFHNKELVDEKIQVSLKLIISNNQEVISRVIRSTNSQTEIKAQDLLAYSNFQKRLEDFYNTFSGQNIYLHTDVTLSESIECPFAGTFDGNGYSISGPSTLNRNLTDETNTYTGAFLQVASSAIIKNTKFKNF